MNNIDIIQQHLQLIYRAKDLIRDKLSTEIEFALPLLTRHEQSVAQLNTINLIQGKAGSHKSRLVEIICAALLSSDPDKNYLGFERPHYPADKFLSLYIDTERNVKDQFPKALQRIIEMSGHTNESIRNHLDYISLIPIDRASRLIATEGYIDTIRKNIDKHLVIIMDVISDCISDFNQASESMKLIDYMNMLINDYDVTFICIIHENPSSEDKARGHLGTELRNKASTVIQIGFVKKKGSNEESDVIRIRFLKNRVGKRPETFYAVYCSSYKTLIEVDKEKAESILERQKDLKITVLDIRTTLVEKAPITRQDLISQLEDKYSVSRNTVLKRLKEILDQKQFEHDGIIYHLITEMKGREKFYSLSWQEEIKA